MGRGTSGGSGSGTGQNKDTTRILSQGIAGRSGPECGPAHALDLSESIGNDGLWMLIGVEMARRITSKERTPLCLHCRGSRFHRKFSWTAKENGIGAYSEGTVRLPPSEESLALKGKTMNMKARKDLMAIAWLAMFVAVIAIASIEPVLAGHSGR